MNQANQSIIYVSCSKGDCIEVLALDQTNGTLSAIQTVALPGNGMPLAFAPNRRHLYAAISANVNGTAQPQYVTYRIDKASGTLDHLATIQAPGRMSHITVDHSGCHLLGASVSNNLIASHAIEADGQLCAEATQILSVPSKAHQITTNHTNQFAFVPNLGADLVMQLTFDAVTGRLTDNSPPHIDQPEGAAPRHIAHHPNGRFAYLLNEEDGSVAALTIDATSGTLTQFQASDFLPKDFDGKPWGAQILVSPDGRFLYTSERKSSTLALHAIDNETGCITKRQTWPTVTCPRNFAISPSGQYLVAAGEKSDKVACYAIDPATGDLEKRSDIATGTGPLWVEVLELT
ncbi:MAG: lactonase family protein [Hyphomicrobiaceae bacterium]